MIDECVRAATRLTFFEAFFRGIISESRVLWVVFIGLYLFCCCNSICIFWVWCVWFNCGWMYWWCCLEVWNRRRRIRIRVFVRSRRRRRGFFKGLFCCMCLVYCWFVVCCIVVCCIYIWVLWYCLVFCEVGRIRIFASFSAVRVAAAAFVFAVSRFLFLCVY